MFFFDLLSNLLCCTEPYTVFHTEMTYILLLLVGFILAPGFVKELIIVEG